VALAIYDQALRSNPLAVDVNMLSTTLATSRATVMRTLDELHRTGFIHIKTTAGRFGGTEAILLHREWFGEQNPAHLNPPIDAQNYETRSTAPQRAGQLPGQFPEQFNQPVLDLSNPSLPDPDPSSGLQSRSPTSETEQRTPPDAMTTNEPNDPATNPQGKRPKIDPAKIPPPAWRAADGLRAQILKHDPAHKIGTVKWDGDSSGIRLKWAHVFDLMNRLDRRDWGEIGGVIRWLYPDDASKGPSPAARMFVILSPESLREKFDRVQAARRREHTEPSSRNPDTRQPPAFKSWGGS
jgi:hypothetical protein